MALESGPDISGCLEITIGYGNLLKFDSGRYGIFWDYTGESQEVIWGKDPTCCVTGACFYLQQLGLSCATNDQPVAVFDGSGGAQLVRLSCGSLSGNSQTWDFEGDPLVCLTGDNTQSLSICAGDGFVNGYFKGFWGPKPT